MPCCAPWKQNARSKTFCGASGGGQDIIRYSINTTDSFSIDYGLHDEATVSKAIEQIVAGYVKVRDRRALADLLAHRRKVFGQLQQVSGINPQNAIEIVEEELRIIEAGLEELKPPPGSIPDNEWG